MKSILLISLLAIFPSICLGDVKVKEIPLLSNDFGFRENFLKFFNDDTFLTPNVVYDGKQALLPFELNSAINGATFLDRNNKGEILGKVVNLSAVDTLAIFVWSQAQGVREIISFPTTAGSPQVYILGGGLGEDGTVKVLYANEYVQRTLPVTLIVSKVGQSVKQFTYNTGFDTKCAGAACPNGIGHTVLGLGREEQLMVEVVPLGFNGATVGLYDEGQVLAAPSDYTPLDVPSVLTTEKNLFKFNFTGRSVNSLLTFDNTVEAVSAPKPLTSTDGVEVHDATADFGIVGDYFQRYRNEKSTGGIGFSLNRWGYLLKPGGKTFERIECKIKPSLLENLVLTSALKINSSGNIIAQFKKSTFSSTKQKSAILTGYQSTNANYCPTATLTVGSECKSIFKSGSNGQRYSTTQKFKNKSKKCSFQFQSKIGKSAITDGKFFLTANGKRSRISDCRNGLCRFTINLDRDNGQYAVTGPEDSKKARNTVRFLITNGK
jgi:hypothetical protein